MDCASCKKKLKTEVGKYEYSIQKIKCANSQKVSMAGTRCCIPIYKNYQSKPICQKCAGKVLKTF